MPEPRGQGLILRDSTPADLEAIEHIYAHHVRHGTGSFELDPPTLAEITRRRADVLANGFAHRVAQLHPPDCSTGPPPLCRWYNGATARCWRCP